MTAETILHRRYGTLIVDRAQTPDDHEREGRPNVARVMREMGQSRTLAVRRPNGRKVGLMHEWTKGGRVVYTGPVWV